MSTVSASSFVPSRSLSDEMMSGSFSCVAVRCALVIRLVVSLMMGSLSLSTSRNGGLPNRMSRIYPIYVSHLKLSHLYPSSISLAVWVVLGSRWFGMRFGMRQQVVRDEAAGAREVRNRLLPAGGQPVWRHHGCSGRDSELGALMVII